MHLSKRIILLVLSFVIIAGPVLLLPGCGEDSVTNPVTSNVVAYNNIMLRYSRIVVPSDSNSINLFTGVVRAEAEADKDMTLIDVDNQFAEFYLRSGHYSLNDNGFSTRFGRVSANMTPAEWDAFKTIDTQTLDSLFFTQDNTQPFGTLVVNPGTPQNPVYAFYLEGKFAYGITTKRIYGVIYVKDFTSIDNGNAVQLTTDIRYNTAEQNDFTKP